MTQLAKINHNVHFEVMYRISCCWRSLLWSFFTFIRVKLRARYTWGLLIAVLPTCKVALLGNGHTEGRGWDGSAILTARGLCSHPPHPDGKSARWRCPWSWRKILDNIESECSKQQKELPGRIIEVTVNGMDKPSALAGPSRNNKISFEKYHFFISWLKTGSVSL